MQKNILKTGSLIASAALLAAACGGSGDDSAAEPDVVETAAPAIVAGDDEAVSEEPTISECTSDSTDPIKLGHLTNMTGEFAEFGPFFNSAVDFTLDIINEDPPLGRSIEAIHEDIGTVGEGQAARKLLELDNVDVILNVAHEYSGYRDFMLGYQADNDGPLMPSVHGGSIEREIGGTAAEPLFRGSPMDTAQGSAAVLQARDNGATSIAIVAAQNDGHQLQKAAAEDAAALLGVEVVTIVDVEGGQPSYRAEMTGVGDSGADGVVIFSPPGEGGTMVKNAAEAGLSLTIIGTNEWQEESFITAATMDSINQHKLVAFLGFDNAETAAWDFMSPLWDASPGAEFAGADNSYTMQYYDLLIATALAIEAGCSTSASTWAEAMPLVTSGGTTVYTYEEGIEAIRNGEDIDYSGVTGEFEYTDTGVVSARFAMLKWTSPEAFEVVETLDDLTVSEVDEGTYAG